MNTLKDYYILAMDEKDKITWHEKGIISPNNIEAFHLEATNVKEAMLKVSSKTSKRFLKVLQFKEIE